MCIWGKGQAAGRVGSDFLSAIAGRVNVSPGRRQEKWPVDNSGSIYVTRMMVKLGDWLK